MKKLQLAFYYYTQFIYYSNEQEEHLSPKDLGFAIINKNYPGTFIIVILTIDFEGFFQFIVIHKDSITFVVYLYLFIYYDYYFSKS